MKLIKQGEQEGRRCAVIGLYTDRMAMSVMQRGEQGSFCLYRRQWEGELLDQQGELDVERLAGVADSFRRLAHKLCCEEVHFCGYGLLRYRQGLREELEQKLGCPVQMVSGLQQARAANLGLFDGQSAGRGAAGIYSGDLSTPVFWSCRLATERSAGLARPLEAGRRADPQPGAGGTAAPDRAGAAGARRGPQRSAHPTHRCGRI